MACIRSDFSSGTSLGEPFGSGGLEGYRSTILVLPHRSAAMRTGASSPARATPSGRQTIGTIALTWLAMLGVDLFLHAGLLAPLYDWDSPFLLRPEVAFARIPIGYLGFLVLATALVWLLLRLNVEGGREGAMLGGAFGAVTWGALSLGLWSISTADPGLLAGWWVGQAVELGLGGFVVGSILGGARLRAVAWKLAAIIIVAAISAVVLQVVGYATAPVLVR